jgi:hypothetical protein
MEVRVTQQDNDRGGVSPLAEAAGYAGLLPFLGALLGVGLLPTFEQRDLAQRLALGYGATILSFVGAVHWGLAVAGRWAWSPGVVVGSTLPAVVATLALLVGGQRGLGLLVVGFGLFWVYEHRQQGARLPPAYLSLRRSLSLAVCSLLALTMILSESAGLR